MSCLPCSKVSAQEQNVVKFYKAVYENTGKVFWVYRLSSKDSFKFVENAYFEELLDKQIKPNFSNGAEYFRIDEFKSL